MANSKSALKRVRQSATRTAKNKSLTTRMKTLRKKAIDAASSGDKDIAKKAFSEFNSAVDKCEKNNIIHTNKAANLKSKTSKRMCIGGEEGRSRLNTVNGGRVRGWGSRLGIPTNHTRKKKLCSYLMVLYVLIIV